MLFPTYRSPSWPVWAPRLPNLSQTGNGSTTNGSSDNHNNSYSTPPSQPHKPSRKANSELIPTDHLPLSPPSPLSLVAPRSRFSAASIATPLSSRLRKSSASKPLTPNPASDTPKRNGLKIPLSPSKSEDSKLKDMALVTFRVPEAKARTGSNGNPKIGQASWRGVSKTCEYIERVGKTSPVLRLAEQARAVSSPDPLHRPDQARASFIAAMTAAARTSNR